MQLLHIGLLNKMDKISKKDFEKARKNLPERVEDNTGSLTESEFQDLLSQMQNPVEVQKHLAIKIKVFLDKQIKNEMKDKGYLTENTRKWVESYNNILEKIQKSIYGDKSVNLHLHKVSHSDVSDKIRESKEKMLVISAAKKKKTRKSED